MSVGELLERLEKEILELLESQKSDLYHKGYSDNNIKLKQGSVLFDKPFALRILENITNKI